MSKLFSWLFICLAAGITLWSGGKALFQLSEFFCLSDQVIAKVEKWQIHELSPSQFALTLFYTYSFQGEERKGSHRFPPPYFLNSHAAHESVAKNRQEKVEIWVDRADPSRTALEKKVPWKATAYAVLSLALLLYFFYLRRLAL